MAEVKKRPKNIEAREVKDKGQRGENVVIACKGFLSC
jgi:hypothetical protein